jgi:diguanylate cyclase (GGDEF)-like protein
MAIIVARHQSIAVARAWEAGMQIALRDEATELPTTQFADHFVASEFAAAERGRDVTIVLFGFDDFEEYTRTHGGAAADAAIRQLGHTLKRLTRRMNLSARYGWRADTFLSVLSDADADGAEIFVQRVRDAMAEGAEGKPMPTFSAGIVEFDPSFGTPEEFVQQAERVLADARADGVNGIAVRRFVLKQDSDTRWLKAL